ncbi:bifunctional diaminohydroxyphosphoribosylaminopyrimidine deaminase/5-amino-6-(5-phosphoribosylamino)uracil reductase RibD [Flavobacteriaceae bacterium M23B6Z8]
MNIHEKYINRCIQLAKNGLGTTYPNPLVGSVIVYKDKIIGEGWHYQAGRPHAEVNAINSVQNKSLLPDATIYVSLEPCSHFGKTPPCSDLIINENIKNVVVGTIDPFAKVAGKGIKKLVEAGCKVTVGILEDECKQLNKRFFTFHEKKRPYIVLKWAESIDGYVSPSASMRQENIPQPYWISNKFSKQLVHKWRSQEQAILVGTKTVLSDNPSLTTREWYGTSPLRILIDKTLQIPEDFCMMDGKTPTIVFTALNKDSTKENLSFKKISFDQPMILQILSELYQRGIQSLIVEGGSYTLQKFIDEGLWDEARVFTGATVFKTGTSAPLISGKLTAKKNIITDDLTVWRNTL